MKRLFLILLAAGTLAAAPRLLAEGPASGEMTSEDNRAKWKNRGEAFRNLPDDLKARIKAAKDKAMQDPEVVRLREQMEKDHRAFRQAMKDAMVKADPGLPDALKQAGFDPEMPPHGKGGPKGPKGEKGAESKSAKPGLQNLTEGERQKLMAARTSVQNNPEVLDAKKKLDAAQTPEERKEAGQAYRDAMNSAMESADPSITDILKKTQTGQP